MRGYNDDLIMALAIACWVRDTALTANQRDMEYKKACLGFYDIKVNTKINTTIPGMEGYNRQGQTLDEKLFKGTETPKNNMNNIHG